MPGRTASASLLPSVLSLHSEKRLFPDRVQHCGRQSSTQISDRAGACSRYGMSSLSKVLRSAGSRRIPASSDRRSGREG